MDFTQNCGLYQSEVNITSLLLCIIMHSSILRTIPIVFKFSNQYMKRAMTDSVTAFF